MNDNKEYYPKILLITTEDIYKKQSSVSLTIRSFLDGWPNDKIVQIIAEDLNGRDTVLVDERTFVMGHDSLYLGRFIGRNRQVETHLHNPIKGNSKKRSLKSLFKSVSSAMYKSLPYKMNKSCLDFIKAFHPDCIYTLLTPSRVNRFAYQISKCFNIPILPHIFDNWQNVYLKQSIVEKPFGLLFYSNLKKIIKQNPITLCISEMMCNEYKKIFPKGSFVPLMHSVSDLSLHNRKSDNLSKILIYSGSMYLGRDESLVCLCDAIEKSKENIRENISLHIYCPREQWDEISYKFSKYEFVIFKGIVPQKVLFEELGAAYAMVFVESLEDRFLLYTRLSMSTKIPEYLSSGKPIIAIGNYNQCSINYLLNHDVAYVATREEDIKGMYNDFLLEKNKSEKLDRARRLFILNHEKESQKDKFHQIVMNVLESPKAY